MNATNLGIDGEDFAWSVVPAIEKSFGIQFEQNDFEDVRTYGEMCSVVQSRITSASISDCTSQQAFYKLRKALQAQSSASLINPESLLDDLFPAKWSQRRQTAKAIQQELGMELDLLRMPTAVEAFFTLLLLLSLAGIPITGVIIGAHGALISTICFVAAIAGLYVGSWLGATLRYTTMHEVVKVMSSRFYRQARRNSGTINQTEILQHLSELFSYESGIELRELTPDAILL
jgi:hypothetical protein